MEEDLRMPNLEARQEEGVGEKFKKVATLGGPIRINKKNTWMYLGNSSSTSKEKLFGMLGPLHPGMPYHKAEMAAGSVESDTQRDLVRELMDKGLTREEARRTIKDLLESGSLVEQWDPDLRQKVLVLGAVR